jgi:hypothetical protein
MIRRVAARACKRLADILFRAGDWLVRLAFGLDPNNALMSELAHEAASLDGGPS